MMDDVNDDIGFNRKEARRLFWKGYAVCEIAKKLGENPQTVHSWKRRDEWDSTPEIRRVEATIEQRLQVLISKFDKTDFDLKEIEVLTSSLEKTARVRQYDQTGKESDINPKLKNRYKKRGDRQQQKKNFLDEDQIQQLVEAFDASIFDYQRVWFEAGKKHRIRNLLKSRQIGATWYFAREALIDAITTGRNQIFLSASKAQAYVFKLYILQFVEEVTGAQLTGDPITLWNGSTLYFLGTNFRTAQSYHGNVYMDEYFWIQRFKDFRKVASGMAMHKKWRQTYISTPSAMAHEAYPFWTGGHFNRGRPIADHIKIDVTHKALKDGRLCEDGQWRQVVTVEDALAAGCDLFDLDQLRIEYSADDYNNLLMCIFIDDTASIFSLSVMMSCMVDSWTVWADVRPFSPRPFGDRPVWVGYDPSRSRDDAAIVVLAPPAVPGAKFRILEKITCQNKRFDEQAAIIKRLTERYNVQKITLDITGIGYGVYELVKAFFPAVRALTYSVEVKTRLVLKAQSVITTGRLEYDAKDKDIAAAFMSIRKTTTPSGRQMTYEAVRSDETGHGDVAWAVMHALDNESIQAAGCDAGASQSIMEIF